MIVASSTDGWGTAPFATEDSLELMWEYARYFIVQYMPFIMIVVACFVAMAVVMLIVNIFSNGKNDEEEVEYL